MKKIIDKNYFNFRYIDSIEVSYLLKSIQSYTLEQWNQYSFRQKTFDVHQETLTIPLIFDENFDEKPLYFNEYKNYKNILKEIEEKISKKFNATFKIVRAILVNLPSGCKIEKHVDSGESLESSMRFHIPIITNESCIFGVGNEEKVLNPGEIWEISNTNKIHYVTNSGKEDRIHLIVDLK
jgi:aspartyl/asparaginyl beta-hydroxylase (cupin superfamily)